MYKFLEIREIRNLIKFLETEMFIKTKREYASFHHLSTCKIVNDSRGWKQEDSLDFYGEDRKRTRIERP